MVLTRLHPTTCSKVKAGEQRLECWYPFSEKKASGVTQDRLIPRESVLRSSEPSSSALQEGPSVRARRCPFFLKRRTPNIQRIWKYSFFPLASPKMRASLALWRCRADRPLCDEEATFHGGRGRECSARSYARWARRGALAHRSNHLEHLSPPIPEGKGCRNGGWAYVVDLPICAFILPHTSRHMLELLHSATSLPC